MGTRNKYKGIRPWENAGKAEHEVHLADMHGDGVHFDRELLAKEKLKKQQDKEVEAQDKRKKSATKRAK